MRSMMRVSLEEMGEFFAVQAGKGFEALKTLPARRFNLIITDINTPDINGFSPISFVTPIPSHTT